jgi:hypothetical protein
MNVQHQVKQVGVPPIEVGRRLISAKNIIGQGALNIAEGRVVDEVVPVVIGWSVWADNEILKKKSARPLSDCAMADQNRTPLRHLG